MFQILHELLQITETELLNEDFGNLKFLDKKFQPILKYSTKLHYDRHSVQNELKKSNGMSFDFGRDAIVEQSNFKSSAELERIISDPDKKGILFVIDVKGNQIALIRKYPLDNSDTPKLGYELFLDIDLIEENIKFKEDTYKIEQLLEKLKYINASNIKAHLSSGNFELLSSSQIYSNITSLLKILKLTNFDSDFKVHAVYKDERRLVTRKERAASKELNDKRAFYGFFDKDAPYEGNKILLQKRPGGDDLSDSMYYSKAKNALMARLEDYKKNHAVDLQDLDEMIELVKKKGFLEHLKVKGIAYELYSQNYLDVRNFKDRNFKDKNSKKPNLIYQVNRHTPEFEKVKKKAEYLQDLFGEDEREELIKAYRKIMPPEYIKIELGFGPGGIVPINVEGADSSW